MPLSCVIVDDSDEFGDSATRLLALQGVRVFGRASAATQALSLIAELGPDVALVDVELGDEDGIELTRQLVSQCPGTRVILISLRDRDELAELMAGSGAAGFLRKDNLDARAIEELIVPRS